MDASQEAWLLLRSMAALVAVLALAVVALRFGLPWLVAKQGGARPRQVRVEESSLLDRRHRLVVVSWEGERLLLAVSPERVSLLARREGKAETGGPA